MEHDLTSRRAKLRQDTVALMRLLAFRLTFVLCVGLLFVLSAVVYFSRQKIEQLTVSNEQLTVSNERLVAIAGNYESMTKDQIRLREQAQDDLKAVEDLPLKGQKASVALRKLSAQHAHSLSVIAAQRNRCWEDVVYCDNERRLTRVLLAETSKCRDLSTLENVVGKAQ